MATGFGEKAVVVNVAEFATIVAATFGPDGAGVGEGVVGEDDDPHATEQANRRAAYTIRILIVFSPF
jgi:hypothetical protein